MELLFASLAVAFAFMAVFMFRGALAIHRDNDGISGLLLFIFVMFIGSAFGGIAFTIFVEVATHTIT